MKQQTADTIISYHKNCYISKQHGWDSAFVDFIKSLVSEDETDSGITERLYDVFSPSGKETDTEITKRMIEEYLDWYGVYGKTMIHKQNLFDWLEGRE